MSRTELTLATAAILLLAFVLGWAAHWLVNRVTRVDQSDLGELEKMARALNEAEDLRDQAIAWVQQREADVARELSQTRAELDAAMSGLRAARQEVEYLRRATEGQG